MEKEIISHILELKRNISLVDLDKIERNWKSYGRTKEIYNLALIRMGFKKVKNFLENNNELRLLAVLDKIEKNFEDQKIEVVLQDLDKLEKLSKIIKPEKNLLFNLKVSLPSEIKNDIESDLKELEKCFNYACYRSSIILCGRILEASLHRKYYELTNNDLIEKSPGIGLGKIIEKLKEKKLDLDPNLTKQISLINQVRISSVHKKSVLFAPDREQTYLVISNTIDILNKLFK